MTTEETRIDSGVCEFALADHGAAEQHECHVQAGIALVADPQPAQVVQPGEGALYDPAFLPSPEPCSVLRLAITGFTPRFHSSRRYLSWS
jgi:hypothetical protein